MASDDMPIACYLTSAELREREATLLAQFRSAVIGTEELGWVCFPRSRRWQVDCDYSENDCGRKGVLPLLDIRVGCPTGNRPCDWPRWCQGVLENHLA